MTLARRMWLASELLAMLVGAAFAALIIAVSAQRDATEREARSKDVTTASLQLEKLVSDVETSFLGISLTRKASSLGPYRPPAASCRRASASSKTLVADDPASGRGRGRWAEQIRGVRLTSSWRR